MYNDLFGNESRAFIEESVGEECLKARRRCIMGMEDLPTDNELVKSNGDAAAHLQQVYFYEVIKKLDSIIV